MRAPVISNPRRFPHPCISLASVWAESLAAHLPAWRLVQEARISLPPTMTRARLPLGLPDGRWVVWDERPPSVYILDASGRRVHAFVEAG